MKDAQMLEVLQVLLSYRYLAAGYVAASTETFSWSTFITHNAQTIK